MQVRKVALLCVAALVLAGFAASSAGAVTAYNQSTGTALAVGSSVNSVCNTTCKLTGTVAGVTTTLQCTQMTQSGPVKANPDAAGNVVGAVNSMSFTGCINVGTGGACTVVITGLPWSPDTNHGGLLATSTTAGLAGTGSGTIQISGCLPLGITCSFQGGTAGPIGTSPYTLTNYVSGPWTNTAPQIQIGGTPNVLASPSACGPWATWTASFTVRTGSSGDLVGLR